MVGADMALLPSSFKALEQSFGFSTSQLGALMMAQSLPMAICAPLWGYVADQKYLPQWRVLLLGCAGWGSTMALLACANTFEQMAMLRLVNGASIAAIVPVSQTILAEMYPPDIHGSVFGFLGSSQSGGQFLATLVCTMYARVDTVLGASTAWRLIYFVFAIMSFMFAVPVWWIGAPCPEPRRAHAAEPLEVPHPGVSSAWGSLLTPSFLVITFQGCFGNVPWNVLAFLPMYFQTGSLSDSAAGIIASAMVFGSFFGNTIGGHLGDYMDAKWHRHGRVVVAQASVLMGLLLMMAILLLIPLSSAYEALMILSLIVFGTLASFCQAGTNRPVVAQVVPPEHRGITFAVWFGLEGASAALLGAPLVGFIIQRFGYAEGGDLALNQDALRSAMVWCTSLPWFVCFLAYALLHYTYPSDYKKAQAKGIAGPVE